MTEKINKKIDTKLFIIVIASLLLFGLLTYTLFNGKSGLPKHLTSLKGKDSTIVVSFNYPAEKSEKFIKDKIEATKKEEEKEIFDFLYKEFTKGNDFGFSAGINPIKLKLLDYALSYYDNDLSKLGSATINIDLGSKNNMKKFQNLMEGLTTGGELTKAEQEAFEKAFFQPDSFKTLKQGLSDEKSYIALGKNMYNDNSMYKTSFVNNVLQNIKYNSVDALNINIGAKENFSSLAMNNDNFSKFIKDVKLTEDYIFLVYIDLEKTGIIEQLDGYLSMALQIPFFSKDMKPKDLILLLAQENAKKLGIQEEVMMTLVGGIFDSQYLGISYSEKSQYNELNILFNPKYVVGGMEAFKINFEKEVKDAFAKVQNKNIKSVSGDVKVKGENMILTIKLNKEYGINDIIGNFIN